MQSVSQKAIGDICQAASAEIELLCGDNKRGNTICKKNKKQKRTCHSSEFPAPVQEQEQPLSL